jgi:tRNA A-37 threonylcarbamoyl transferase component Bud32/tetratricopeptide (TPR) repeat protein
MGFTSSDQLAAFTGELRLTATATTTPSTWSPSVGAVLASGTKVGRYVIERALGAGGMGVVYVARDPELGRRIAIKRLHAGTPSERLRREAKALAKLDHKNVVAVYDVGEHDGQCFVAMALVEGRTLRQWRETPHSVNETMRVIIDAGRGLAAAHAAGLIHRDLKPDNIFVADRGHALVGDFGLARSADSFDADTEVRGRADTGVTMEGALVGTPAYMAPEHARGEPTPASDQFALCVTAWETLYGTRPFEGGTLDEILESAARGQITEPRAARAVPKRVRRALERGLAAAPEARWPSIDALLAELAHGRARRSRTAVLACAGVAIVAVSAWRVGVEGSEGTRCRSADTRLSTAWTPARAAELRAVVGRVAPYATMTIDHAIERLDAYAVRWRSSWDNTCRSELSDVGFDLRIACLEQQLHALAAAADTLRATDRTSAFRALDVPSNLPDIERCDDLASLRKTAPPRAIADKVAAIQRELARGNALLSGGKYADADTVLQRARRDADALGYPAVQGTAHLALGRLALAQLRVKEAKPILEAALNHAIAGGDDETTARTYVNLAKVAVALSDGARIRELDATADAAVRRIGDPPALRAKLDQIDVMIPLMSGDYSEALTRATRTIPQLEASRHMDEARPLYRVRAVLLQQAGRADEARAAYDHEVGVTLELFGMAHPFYAQARLARGVFLFARNEYSSTIEDYEVGYKTLVSSIGPDHPLTIDAGADSARMDLMFGRHDDAIEKARRFAAVAERDRGPANVASAKRLLAQALMAAGRYREAERELAQAAALDRNGAMPFRLADEVTLATLRCRQRRFREVKEIVDRIRPEMVKAFGADSTSMFDIWLLHAQVHLAKGKPAQAIRVLAKIRSGLLVADAEMLRAEALERLRDRAGARAARERARALLDGIGAGSRPDLRAELAKKQDQ